MMKTSWRILVVLVGILLFFLAMHLIFTTTQTDNMDYWELVNLINMDSEISLFTWYSVTILLFVPAVLLFYIGWIKRKSGKKPTWGWFLTGGVLLYLSIDDGAMIHEKLSTINRLTGFQDFLNGINPYLFGWSWWVIYIPIALVLGIVLIRWLLSLPRRTQILIIIAAVLAVVGQIGMEAVSSYVSNSAAEGEYVSMAWRGLQKFTGRLGLSLFLFAIIDYILITPNLKSRFKSLLG